MISVLTRAPSRATVGKLLRAPLRLVPAGLRVPVLSGPLRGSWWIAGAATHACWLGTYEYSKQIAFAERVRPGYVVYDLGANVGFYTLLGAARTGPDGRVYSFEPLPRNLLLLRRHIEMNRLANVVVIDGAVGGGGGTVRLAASGSPSMARVSSEGEHTVRSVTIDDLIKNDEVLPPDIMKIDVEGMEADALRGSGATLAEYRPTVLVATHGSKARSECLTLLRRLDYRISSLDGRPFEESDEFVAERQDRAGDLL